MWVSWSIRRVIVNPLMASTSNESFLDRCIRSSLLSGCGQGTRGAVLDEVVAGETEKPDQQIVVGNGATTANGRLVVVSGQLPWTRLASSYLPPTHSPRRAKS